MKTCFRYEAEQKQLEAEVSALRQEIGVPERQIENIEKFIPKAENMWVSRKSILMC